VDVVRIGGKLGEVIGKIGDEIGVENRLVAKSFVSTCKLVLSTMIAPACLITWIAASKASKIGWQVLLGVIPLQGIPIRTLLRLEK
jgi:hypothetical protein